MRPLYRLVTFSELTWVKFYANETDQKTPGTYAVLLIVEGNKARVAGRAHRS